MLGGLAGYLPQMQSGYGAQLGNVGANQNPNWGSQVLGAYSMYRDANRPYETNTQKQPGG